MHPRDLNSIAADIATRIGELEAEKQTRLDRDQRREVNRRLHALRGLLDWAKSREGYEPTPQDLGLLEVGEGEP